MISRNSAKWLLSLGIGGGAALIGSLATVLDSSQGQAVAFALIGGASGFSASLLYFLYRSWPSHQYRIATIGRHAATSSASAWFDRVLQPRIPLPSLSGMALQPETAGYLVRAVQAESADIVLELGSGVSTLLVAYSLEQQGRGMIYSFESERIYADHTRALLKAHALTHRVELVHAPLDALGINGWNGRWFQQTAFGVVPDNSVDLLLVDGPPKATGPLARYPAVPVLSNKLKRGCLVLVDDADRSDEKMICERWTREGLLADPSFLPLGTGLLEARIVGRV